MTVETTTRWRAKVQYSLTIEAYVDNESVVLEQGENRLTFGKQSGDDVITAINLALAACPEESDEVPF